MAQPPDTFLHRGSIPYGVAPQHCPDMLQAAVAKIKKEVKRLIKTGEFSACNLTH
jgi:hypothetical protein